MVKAEGYKRFCNRPSFLIDTDFPPYRNYSVVTRTDLHVKILDETVINRAKARGLELIVYAPHFTQLPTIEARAAEYSSDTVTVLPAREIFTGPWWQRRHLLAIGLQDPIPDFIPLELAISEVKRQGAALLVPHPTFFSVSMSASDIDQYASSLDAIEVYNPKHLPFHNNRAERLASRYTLPRFASSYAHLPTTVGEVWTKIEADIEDVHDLRDAIQSGAVASPTRRPGFTHRLRQTAEIAHLGWENSWQKFERTILKGTESTHPTNPLYPNRFRDAIDA